MPSGKPQRLFDVAGLYLEISSSGSEWWRSKYRFAGKEKRLALGAYPETTLAEARVKHAEARKVLSLGQTNRCGNQNVRRYKATIHCLRGTHANGWRRLVADRRLPMSIQGDHSSRE